MQTEAAHFFHTMKCIKYMLVVHRSDGVHVPEEQLLLAAACCPHLQSLQIEAVV